MDHQKQLAHLRRDPVMKALIKRLPAVSHDWYGAPRRDHFRALVVAIVNQQLSGKAAATILARFIALFPRTPSGNKSRSLPADFGSEASGPSRNSSKYSFVGPDASRSKSTRNSVAPISGRDSKKFPQPEDVLKMSVPKMRKAGLSKMKVSFLKDLSRHVIAGTVDFKKMKKMDDAEVIDHLICVKGIGRWTAEMFLMFSLRREDIFSYGDLGLRNAMRTQYGLRKHPTEQEAAKISAAWVPYRTLASLYLWASVDNKE